jgi:hypothetical protein
MWVLLNRLLCVLQPLEELRTSKASASRSLDLNYTSLPPQLVAFGALRAQHFLLAAVCAMALLSNLLATSFAGLFFRDDVEIARPTSFRPTVQPQFVRIDGTAGPTDDGFWPGMVDGNYSGAFQGGAGTDQFLVLESNYTRNTTLIPWLGKTAAYLPFKAIERDGQGHDFQAQTLYMAAKPNCRPLVFRDDYKLVLWVSGKVGDEFEVSVVKASEPPTTCYAPVLQDLGEFKTYLGYESRRLPQCRSGRVAAELLINLHAGPNATQSEREICMTSAIMGWMRTIQASCDLPTRESENKTFVNWQEANEDNTFLMLCQPRLEVGTAQVRIDANGTLLDEPVDVKPDSDQSNTALMRYTTNGVENVIGQSNLFLFRTLYPSWHNDSFASENIHYFVNRERGDLRLTDPNTRIPNFTDVEEAVDNAFVRLFATWVAVNRDLLFLPATNATPWIEGFTIVQEKRLFFNLPMFIVSECILGIYVIVSILMYIRRPGRYLPRMPVSIAAVIALFASSAAVKEFRNTSDMKNKERKEYLQDLNRTYGYGSYVGSDGAVHVGIEKTPYVQYMKEVTFVGSRAERELRKRNSREQSPTAAAARSIEDDHTSLEDSVESNSDDSGGSERSVSPPESTEPHNQSEGLTEALLRESDVEGARDTTLEPRDITCVTRAEYVCVSLEDTEDERVEASLTQ